MLINTIWIGGEMGPIHAACLRSFVRHGHEILLHCYERPKDAPDGIKFFDARQLMNENEVIRHKETGSLALGANLYRYRIMRSGMGPYVDCDVFCIKPFEQSEYMFGYEANNTFNNAVLNMPKDCDLLEKLLKAANNHYFIPPWLPEKKQRKERIRLKFGFGKHVSKRTWGVFGPRLLTHYVNELGLSEKAARIDTYYPLHFEHVRRLWDEGVTVDDLVTENTFGLHLWNAYLDRFNQPIKPNTPLYEIVNS